MNVNNASHRRMSGNEVTSKAGVEHSVYCAEKKLVSISVPMTSAQPLPFPEFGKLTPESGGVN